MMNDANGNEIDDLTDTKVFGYTCDRCGARMDSYWETPDGAVGGNCGGCGDDLCAACAKGFDDDGECGNCKN
jgi:hypothetical protein